MKILIIGFLSLLCFLTPLANAQIIEELAGGDKDTLYTLLDTGAINTKQLRFRLPFYLIDTIIAPVLREIVNNDTLCNYFINGKTGYSLSVSKREYGYQIGISPVYLDSFPAARYSGVFNYKDRIFLCWGQMPEQLFHKVSDDSISLKYYLIENYTYDDSWDFGAREYIYPLMHKDLKINFIIRGCAYPRIPDELKRNKITRHKGAVRHSCNNIEYKHYFLEEGFCSNSFFLFSDSTYIQTGGCEASSHITNGKWSLKKDRIKFFPGSRTGLNLLCEIKFSRFDKAKIRDTLIVVVFHDIDNRPIGNFSINLKANDVNSKKIETLYSNEEGIILVSRRWDSLELQELRILAGKRICYGVQNFADTVIIKLRIKREVFLGDEIEYITLGQPFEGILTRELLIINETKYNYVPVE